MQFIRTYILYYILTLTMCQVTGLDTWSKSNTVRQPPGPQIQRSNVKLSTST